MNAGFKVGDRFPINPQDRRLFKPSPPFPEEAALDEFTFRALPRRQGDFCLARHLALMPIALVAAPLNHFEDDELAPHQRQRPQPIPHFKVSLPVSAQCFLRETTRPKR
jgi:hypothetical protein